MNELTNNKTIALVGPSKSLFNQEYGNLIDTHDIVIRINRFDDISQYIKNVGSKTNILYHNFYRCIPNVKRNNDVLLIKSSHPLIPKIPKRSINNKKFYIKSKKQNGRIKHCEYQRCVWDSLMMYYRAHIRNYPSSGISVIYDIIDNIDKCKYLSVFGIDFCLNNYIDSYSKYNCNVKNKLLNTHNMAIERKIFAELYSKHKNKIIIHDKIFLLYINILRVNPKIIDLYDNAFISYIKVLDDIKKLN